MFFQLCMVWAVSSTSVSMKYLYIWYLADYTQRFCLLLCFRKCGRVRGQKIYLKMNNTPVVVFFCFNYNCLQLIYISLYGVYRGIRVMLHVKLKSGGIEREGVRQKLIHPCVIIDIIYVLVLSRRVTTIVRWFLNYNFH